MTIDHTSDSLTAATGNAPLPGNSVDSAFATAPPAQSPAPPTQSPAQSVDADSLALEFRVIRDGMAARRLRLTGNRYTFGSAEGCSIRLSDPALRPMHAVLLHDPTAVTLRCYSEPVRINGIPRLEAMLSVGDVIQLGGYQFSLIDRQTPRFEPMSLTSASPWSSSSQEPTSVVTDTSATARPEEDNLWRQRLRDEIDQWRQRQRECEAREEELRERESDLWRRAAELQQRDDLVRDREGSLRSREADLAELEANSSARATELESLRQRTQRQSDALRDRESELESHRHELQEQEERYQDKLDDAARQLMQSQEQADAATASVARIGERFESLNQQVEELTAHQAELERRERKAIEQQQAIRDDLNRQREQVTQANDLRDQANEERAVAQQAQVEAEDARRHAEQVADAKTREVELASQRLDELSRQVADLREQAIAETSIQDGHLRESRDEIDRLREQIEQLQTTVDSARQESQTLRERCETAEEKVRELESAAASLANDSALADTERLRTAMDELSLELAQANEELSQVRRSNESLTAELDGLRQERDQAIARQEELTQQVANSVPREDYQSLQEELESVRNQLAQSTQEHADLEAKMALAEDHLSSDRSHDDPSNPEPSAAIASSDPPAIPSPTSEDVWQQDQAVEEPDQPPTNAEAASSVGMTIMDDDSMSMTQIDSETDPAPEAYPEPETNSELETNSEPETDQVAQPDWGSETNHEIENEIDNPWPTYQASDDRPEPASPWESTEPDSSAEPMGPAESAESYGWAESTESVESTAEFDSSSSWNTPPGFDNSQAFDAMDERLEEWEPRAEPEASESSQWLADAETDPPAPWPSLESGGDDDASIDGDLTENELAAEPIEAAPMPNEPIDDQGADVSEGSLASMLIQDLEAAQDDPEPTNENVVDPIAERGGDLSDPDTAMAPDMMAPDALDPSVIDPGAMSPPEASPWQPNELESDGTYVMPSLLRDDLDDDPAAEASFAGPTDTGELADGDLAGGELGHREPAASDWDPDNLGHSEPGHSEPGHSEPAAPSSEVSLSDAFPPPSEEPAVAEPSGWEAAPEPTDAPEANRDEPDTGAATSAANEEPDDDSIEAYMNRLLGRVQGRSGSEPATADSVSMSSVTKSTSVSQTPVPDAPGTLSTELDAQGEPVSEVPDAPIVPRSQAPEKNSDLSAMRQLANETARSAISVSAKKQSRQIQMQAIFHFMVAGVCILVGGIATAIVTPPILYVSWLMAVVATAVSIKQGFSLWRESRERGK